MERRLSIFDHPNGFACFIPGILRRVANEPVLMALVDGRSAQQQLAQSGARLAEL
jgi:hypothetical protein